MEVIVLTEMHKAPSFVKFPAPDTKNISMGWKIQSPAKLKMGWRIQSPAKLKMGWRIQSPAKLKMGWRIQSPAKLKTGWRVQSPAKLKTGWRIQSRKTQNRLENPIPESKMIRNLILRMNKKP